MITEIRPVTMQEMIDRYGCASAGDYWRENGKLNIRCLKMDNEDYMFLVCLHELIEEYLCTKRGIKEIDIQKFDQDFEKAGKEGEPGDDRDAPYFNEHQFATEIEMLMCNELGIKWPDYDKAIEALFD
jgi:hypothetical protein